MPVVVVAAGHLCHGTPPMVRGVKATRPETGMRPVAASSRDRDGSAPGDSGCKRTMA